MTVAALDTVHRVATPEGIELSLRLAGPVPRALAWLLDFALRVGVFIAIATVAGYLGGFGTALVMITIFALEWLFPAFCEVHLEGATPGKRALGLMVVHDDGRPVRWGAALIRNLLRAVDFLPLFYAIGLVAMLCGRDFKRLGDIAARTTVIYRDTKRASATIAAVPAAQPAVPLHASEQRAILDFAARVPQLTEERAAELAAIPARLVGGATGGDATRQLVAIANHLLGRRDQADRMQARE